MERKVEPARIADVPRLVDLLNDLFGIELDFTADASRQQRGLELLIGEAGSGVSHTVAVVRDADGAAIAMASAQLVISTSEGALSAWIEDVVVHPDFRRQGIGRLLLDYLQRWAKERGATRAQLVADEGNELAASFYTSLGWETTQLGLRRRFLS